MSLKRFLALTTCALGLTLIAATAPAGAAGPTQVLKLFVNHSKFTAVGFDPRSTSVPPIGSKEIITGALFNSAPQFGKPKGRRVGRFLVDCTVLSEAPDGVCTGIAHVPNGFFTFVGNGPFTKGFVRFYAVTGGIGPYAHDSGVFKVTNHTGRVVPDVLVTLFG